MEEFLKINWSTDINDIVDRVFIDEDRIMKESVMYKILSGTFKDPVGISTFEEQIEKPQIHNEEPKKRGRHKKNAVNSLNKTHEKKN